MSNKQSLVSIDFWDTLVVAETGGRKRRQIRHEALCEIADEYVRNLPNAQIESATQEASDEFHRIWLNEQRTPTSRDLIERILNHLGIPASEKQLEYLVDQFEKSMLEGPPDLVENAKESIEELSSGYKLALISDTMYSPGNIIRKYLDSRDLLDHFSAFVFSNETGYSKPNPKAYTEILEETNCDAELSFHIGDRIDTDIKGANNVGMNSILFTGASGAKEYENSDIEPDHICENWEEVLSIL